MPKIFIFFHFFLIYVCTFSFGWIDYWVYIKKLLANWRVPVVCSRFEPVAESKGYCLCAPVFWPAVDGVFGSIHGRVLVSRDDRCEKGYCCCSSVVERVLGKDEVMGSSPISS